MPRPRKEPPTGALTVSAGRAILAEVPGGYASPHPQWEYLELLSWDGRDWEGGDFNTLGLQGWELTVIYATWSNHTAPRYHAVFKRRVSNG